MKKLSRLTVHFSLLIAFIVGSVAYWGSLGILAFFIWTLAIGYTILYRLYRATTVFFKVLLSSPTKVSKTAKSSTW